MFLTVLKFTAVSLVITALVALGLILSDRPKNFSDAEDAESLDFESTVALGISDVPPQKGVTMGNGWDMPIRSYGVQGADKPLLILIHGSGWSGLQFNRLANALANDAYVVVPDLRGHGASPERRGDMDYINQMEDDLAALIKAQAREDQKVIVAGHSSGGGLVVRFAGGEHSVLMDEAILLAPFLKYNAPTTRENSGGWAHAMTRRIIGLSMLNTFKITALNHLEIIQFNMPKAAREGKYGHLATLSYTYRLNTGYAPRMDYLKDIAALPNFTLIAGAQDEAFHAEKYEEVMSGASDKGSYHISDGESHLSIVNAASTETLILGLLK
ncbi:MAG: alpha/beta fold hydrolase [Rhodobacteraceae bacterium]|jgi:pimeloyl-ACP methyl ester carboxylesterase|nr:alpha/beta fold hydrolase [Paracoccaceae bacterium]